MGAMSINKEMNFSSYEGGHGIPRVKLLNRNGTSDLMNLRSYS